MPIGSPNSISLRAQNHSGAGGNAQYSMVSDNPVFKIKVRSLATDYEQNSDNGNDNKNVKSDTKSFKVGDRVEGSDFDGEVKSGEIIKIYKNRDNNISSIQIIDNKDKKKYKLDPVTCKVKTKSNTNKPDNEKTPYYGESKLLDIEDFICV